MLNALLLFIANTTPVDPTVSGALACKGDKLLGIIPPWYQYLEMGTYPDCVINLDLTNNPGNFWLVGFGVIDILLRVAGLVAVAFVIYGGFRYVTSQGESENLKNARNTIINALIGVSISIVASSLVSFFVKVFKG